jgi:hypothetical protein
MNPIPTLFAAIRISSLSIAAACVVLQPMALRAQGPIQQLDIYIQGDYGIQVGIEVVPVRPPEPVVQEPPLVILGLEDLQAEMIVQKLDFRANWPAIEIEVADALLQLHHLAPDQRSRLMRWERGMMRAALWNRVVEIIAKEPAARTPTEQSIYNGMVENYRQMRIACAQHSIDEYNRWAINPSAFKPVEGFTYHGGTKASDTQLGVILGGPKPPSFEEFTQYGVMLYVKSLGDDDAFAEVASEAALRSGALLEAFEAERLAVLAGGVAGTIVVGGLAGAIGAALGASVILTVAAGATSAAATLLTAVFPFAFGASASAAAGGGWIASTGGVLAGATAVAVPVIVAIIAVVGSVMEGIAVVNAIELPGKLQAEIGKNQSAEFNLRDLTGLVRTVYPTDEEEKKREKAREKGVLSMLYSTFLASTLPDIPAPEQAPPATGADPQWLTAAFGTAAYSSNPSIELLDATGKQISVRLMDGWFVVRDESGKERLALCLSYLDSKGITRLLSIMGTRLFSTQGPGTGEMLDEIDYLNWTKQQRQAKIGVGGLPASLAPSVLPDAKVGDIINQPLAVSNPGGGTYTYSLARPNTLPAGLSLSSTGAISGTLRAAGVYAFEVLASNSGLPSKPARVLVRLRVAGTLAPQPPNQIASYRFEGNANDSTGANHGYFLPVPVPFVDGFVGQAASFQPVTIFTSTLYPYMVLPQDIFPKPLATAPRSFEAWFKTSLDGPILGQAATSGEALPAIYVGTNGHLHVSFFRRPSSAPPVEIATRVDNDQWHHVATTFDGVNQRVYLNGELRATVGGTVDVGSGIYNYNLGQATMSGSPNAGRSVFRGLIDEVAIYSRALQPTEVTALHAAGPTGRAGVALGNIVANGTFGVPLEAAIPVSDGSVTSSSAASLTVVGGALPFGLILDADSASIRGTPRSVGTFSFTVRAMIASGHSGERTYTMVIDGPPRPLADGLRAWWRYEPDSVFTTSGGGTAFRSYPENNYPLYTVNAMNIGPGKVGQAYGSAAAPPDPVSPMLIIQQTFPGGGAPFTFETWFSATGPCSILKQPGTGQPVLWVGSDGLLRGNVAWAPGSSTTMVSPRRVDDGTWHHLALTWLAGEQRLFVDGALVATSSGLTSGSGMAFSSSAVFEFAGGTVNSTWEGITANASPPRPRVDETAVFSRALTPLEVGRIFASGDQGKSLLDFHPKYLPAANRSSYYNETVTVTGLTGTVSWTIGEGSLPPGMRLVTVGNAARIVGTPHSARSSTFTLVCSDSNGHAGAIEYTLRVDGPPATLPANATAWWRGEQNYEDSLPGGRHASANFNNPIFVPLESGHAFSFRSGVAGLLIPTNSFPPLVRPDESSPATSNAPYTFEAWFATNHPGVILGMHSKFYLASFIPTFSPPTHAVPAIYVGTDGKLHTPMFSIHGQPGTVSPGRVDDGLMHHVAVTYDGSNLVTYLNGVAIGTVSGRTSRFDGTTSFLEVGIGYNGASGTGTWSGLPTGWSRFQGIMDEIVTYSGALSASTVLLQYQAGGSAKALLPQLAATFPPGFAGTDYFGLALFSDPSTSAHVTGDLPPGMVMTDQSVLTGTPTTAGTYQFDVSFQIDSGWGLLRCTLRIDGNPSPRWADTAWYRGESGLAGFVAGENAVASGVVSTVPGRVGNAFRFDTDTSRLTISGVNVSPTGGSWSFETWFRAAGPGILLSGPANGQTTAVLSILPDGRLRLQQSVGGPVVATTAIVDDNLFHHVAVTHHAGTYTIYLDGIPAETTSGGDIPSVTTTNPGVCLGGGGYRGTIDEAQFYSLALTADQVRRIHAAGDLGKSTMTITGTVPVTAVGTPLATTLAASGGPGPFTFRLAGGRLPNGINLSPGGLVSGTTWVSGSFPVSVEATAANGTRVIRDYQLVVEPGMRYRAPGLKAWWQAENNFTDWRGQHAISPVVEPDFAPGMRGNAFSFNGEQFAILPSSAFRFNESGEFTFETWFLPRWAGGILGWGNTIFQNRSLIHVGWDGRLYAAPDFKNLTPDFIVSADPVVDGSWHHVAMTFGGGSVSVYLDGELLGSAPAPDLSLTFGENMTLGRALTTNGLVQGDLEFTGRFDGLIDEPATWFRKLSAEEIALLVRCGPNGKADGVFPAAGPLPSAVRGRSYPQTLSLTGVGAAALSLVDGDLPDSLLLPATAGGVFTGAPATIGNFDFTVSGVSSAGLLRDRQRVDEQFSLTVDPLTESATYDMWIGEAGLPLEQSMPGFKPSADMPNLLRYAFNLAPNTQGRPVLSPGTGNQGLPWMGKDPQGRLVIEFVRRKASGNPGIVYVVETGEDLSALTPLSLANAAITSVDTSWERVRVVDPVATAKRFGRLRISVGSEPLGNLLQNGSGASPVTTGWTILANGGNGWANFATGGYDATPGHFRTSYGWCRRSQTIDLVAAGLTPQELDQQPRIRVGEAISSFMNNNVADSYYIKVELRDQNQNVIASWNQGTLGAPLSATTDWVLHQHDFTSYGPGVRYVYFEDGGIDNGYWAGPFGTYHDAASVEVIRN